MPGVYDPAGRISNQKDGSKLADLYRELVSNTLAKRQTLAKKGMKVLKRMQRGKLKIFKTLSRTLTEMRMYSRDDGIIKDGNDHLLDAMRYVIMSGLGLFRSYANSEPGAAEFMRSPFDSGSTGWMSK